MNKKPYYIYDDLCKKIETDVKSIKELKDIIKEKDKEIDFLKMLINKSDITVNSLIDFLINNDLTSQQRKFINEIITRKVGEMSDE